MYSFLMRCGQALFNIAVVEDSSMLSTRYYGGARFQPLALAGGEPRHTSHEEDDKGGETEKPSAEWRPFGGHWLVLPLVELCAAGDTTGRSFCALDVRHCVRSRRS